MNPDPIPGSTTINQVFDAFLDAQELRLSTKTLRQYEDIIDLLRLCLDSYGVARGPAAERRGDVPPPDGDERSFCDRFGPESILPNVGQFLGYFMVHKVVAGKDTTRAAGTVTRQLARWLVEMGYATRDEESAGSESGARTSRELLRAREVAEALLHFAEDEGGDAKAVAEGTFVVTRIEGGKLWLSLLVGGDAGAVVVPEDVASAVRAGWTISGVIGRRGRRQLFVEVWTVDPMR